MQQGKTTQTNNSMPNAIKFLKEFLTNKWKLDEASHETRSKNTLEPYSSNDKRPIYEERRLQVKELDEWRTQKSRSHDKPKPVHDELNISPNQLKVGDKVLLDAADPRIATSEPNGKIPLTVLSISPYSTVKVFPEPHGQAHGHALDHAHTTGGNTAVRYSRVKTKPNFSQHGIRYVATTVRYSRG
ncbi:hypothetical protein GOBAR_AA36680 [Gossypium barbadense]|uniref:Uncharacterized protein n=1 Tax=Gossypium barbadense TaxID=3634 RepID=A0A2P5VYX4_GOSBA|nr:hypothetical protein GOBAR_AA36680 [Gossypium barbadense]